MFGTSIGPQSYPLAFDVWFEGLPCRCDLVLLVQIDVLHCRNRVLIIQRVATLLSPMWRTLCVSSIQLSCDVLELLW